MSGSRNSRNVLTRCLLCTQYPSTWTVTRPDSTRGFLPRWGAGLSPGAGRSRCAEKQKRQRCPLLQAASFVLRVLQRLLRLLLPLRRRIAEESHDIGTGIAAWYCEAAAEKGEEVNLALVVFQRTKQRSRKPKKLAAAWRRRREINHHSTSRSVGSLRERERGRGKKILRLCWFDAGRLRIGDFVCVSCVNLIFVFFVDLQSFLSWRMWKLAISGGTAMMLFMKDSLGSVHCCELLAFCVCL